MKNRNEQNTNCRFEKDIISLESYIFPRTLNSSLMPIKNKLPSYLEESQKTKTFQTNKTLLVDLLFIVELISTIKMLIWAFLTGKFSQANWVNFSLIFSQVRREVPPSINVRKAERIKSSEIDGVTSRKNQKILPDPIL